MSCVLVRSEGCLDIPDMECSECGAVFNLCWNRNPLFDGPEYCPFCGEEVEDIVDE